MAKSHYKPGTKVPVYARNLVASALLIGTGVAGERLVDQHAGPHNGLMNVDTGVCDVDEALSSGVEEVDGAKEAVRVIRATGVVRITLRNQEFTESEVRDKGKL